MISKNAIAFYQTRMEPGNFVIAREADLAECQREGIDGVPARYWSMTAETLETDGAVEVKTLVPEVYRLAEESAEVATLLQGWHKKRDLSATVYIKTVSGNEEAVAVAHSVATTLFAAVDRVERECEETTGRFRAVWDQYDWDLGIHSVAFQPSRLNPDNFVIARAVDLKERERNALAGLPSEYWGMVVQTQTDGSVKVTTGVPNEYLKAMLSDTVATLARTWRKVEFRNGAVYTRVVASRAEAVAVAHNFATTMFADVARLEQKCDEALGRFRSVWNRHNWSLA